MMRSQLISAIVLMALAGCAPTLANRGNLLDPEKVAAIRPGETTRDRVADMLGTPSARGSFDDNSWYYIGRRTEQYAFLDPKVTEQQIIAVTFDAQGVVQKVETLGKDMITPVAAAPGETPTFGQETTWLQDLFGNIGRAGMPISRNQR